jgi:hypothetical protein
MFRYQPFTRAWHVLLLCMLVLASATLGGPAARAAATNPGAQAADHTMLFHDDGDGLHPELNCVASRSDGSLLAIFGYTNTLDKDIHVPIGPANSFQSDTADRGQPVWFAPGHRRGVFAVAFDGARLEWRLGARSAAASTDSGRCPVTTDSQGRAYVDLGDGVQVALFADTANPATPVVDAASVVDPSGNAGRLRDVYAPVSFLNTTRAIPSGEWMRIEVVNPSAGADPVLHVQDLDSAEQTFVAGNDDCIPGSVASGSCVTVPADTAMSVRIVVRPYGTNKGGSARMRISTPSAGTEEFDFTFDGTVIDVPPMAAQARVLTVRQNRGFASPATQPHTNDTYLLVSRDVEYAITVDDDDGVNNMSQVILPENCSSRCQIVVATYDHPAGVTTVIWDETIGIAGHDPDADGLSTALETAITGASIGTNPNDRDTDDDGIPDGVEVLGIDGRDTLAEPAVEYPFYGADPLHPDIFVEVDWVDSAANQWSGEAAQNTAHAFLGNLDGTPDPLRDIRVHIDNGVHNPNTDARRFVWGDWSGASQFANDRPTDVQPLDWWCEKGFTPTRRYFHHGVSGVGDTSRIGKCFLASPGNGAHELGHNYSGSHGGFPDAGLNGNAIYKSVMNYAFEADRPQRFSKQQFGDLRLNPSKVNEVRWAQGLSPAIVQYLERFTAVENQKVDWNQDNVFTDGDVRGQINFTNEMGKWHNQCIGRISDTPPHGDLCMRIDAAAIEHAQLSWLRGSPNKLFLFALKDGGISYWTSADVGNCAKFLTNHWGGPGAYCNTWRGPEAVPNLRDVTGHFGVTWYVPSATGVRNLMLVYRKTDNTLRYQILDGSTGRWSGEQPLPDNAGVTGGPSIMRSPTGNSSLYAYAPISTTRGHQIYRWTFTSASGWSSAPSAQRYADGTPVLVAPKAGIALTHGYLKGQDKNIFAAIVTTASDGVSTNLIKIVRFDPTTRRWVPLAALNDNPRHAGTTSWGSSARPGFAYVPFTNATDAAAMGTGRFYLLYRDELQSSPAIVKTVGNDPNPVVVNNRRQRDLAWHPKGWEWFLMSWDQVDSSIQLLYDFGLDTNMRAVYSNANTIVWAPIADGRANAHFRDYDDLVNIRRRLDCPFVWDPGKC